MFLQLVLYQSRVKFPTLIVDLTISSYILVHFYFTSFKDMPLGANRLWLLYLLKGLFFTQWSSFSIQYFQSILYNINTATVMGLFFHLCFQPPCVILFSSYLLSATYDWISFLYPSNNLCLWRLNLLSHIVIPDILGIISASYFVFRI